ncbi:hypothetical protein MMC24_004864 [Lignoscripta atroalba]|nr:hypothetical protein [Lignoscripta atroalba]
MVKADPKRDYYADLELKPSADTAEIKKQFHKLALKYHPDRNPGREVEFNGRFQILQAAHEVLCDPPQRAKYDADRIRAGIFTSYTSASKPDVPPRSPNVNFPPPPRRTQPPSATKPSFPTTPSAGAGRYAPYAQTEQRKWANPKEDAQARTNAFKAWEHMKHQTPQGRTAPPRPQRSPPKSANSYMSQGSRETGNEMPKTSTPRTRPEWDQYQEPHGSFPSMSRANTTRVPRANGFVPATSGADEQPARNTSAYFNVSRGERPQNSRAQTQYPPPPPGPAPTAKRPEYKKPEPLRPTKTQFASDDPFSNSDRLSTPYATTGGERTYFDSGGLNRSASTRENKAHADWQGNLRPTMSNNPSPATASRHHSASPKMRSPNPRRSFSPSSSSSDESNGKGAKHRFYPSARKTEPEKSTNTQRTVDGHPRPSPNPTVRVEDANGAGVNGGRPQVRSRNARENDGINDAPRPSSASRQGSRNGSVDYQGDSIRHHMHREAESKQQPNLQANATATHQSPLWGSQNSPRPLEKSKSWHEKYGSAENGNNRRNFERPAAADAKDQNPMYDSSDSTPSPNTPSSSATSTQEARLFPDMPRNSSASWPYWAIPSSITPKKRTGPQDSSHSTFHLDQDFPFSLVNNANSAAPDSFTVPKNKKTFPSAPPLRSQSSESIDTAFSPSNWHGKFTGNAEDYLGPTASKISNGTRGRTSPTRGRINPQANRTQQPTFMSNGQSARNGNTQMPPPPTVPGAPPSASPVKFAQEEWAQHFKDGTWAFPPPPPIQSPGIRTATLKRPKTPRNGSKTSNKRPMAPKAASVSATIDDTGEEVASSGTESTVESHNSLRSHSGSAMDIDPDLTPSSTQQQQPTPEKPTHSAPDQPGPAAPPNSNGRLHDDTDSPPLNLGNLKNVAPLAPSSSGLKDLDDLSTTLPFESRPAIVPTQVPAPQRLPLPNPPKAPPVPERLTQVAWDRYTAYMRTYMAEWNAYNSRMLAHFNERQVEVNNKSGGDWITAVGGEGYGRYMRGVEEDFRVREHWDVSWEKHRQCMLGLGEVRAKAVSGKVSV